MACFVSYTLGRQSVKMYMLDRLTGKTEVANCGEWMENRKGYAEGDMISIYHGKTGGEMFYTIECR